MRGSASGRLAERVAVVTGATGGIGRAIAELFATEGAAVVAGGRDLGRGAEVVESIRRGGGRAEFVPGDVGTPEANQALVDRALEAFGGADVLVANAGTLGLGSVTGVPLEKWHETIATNLTSVFYLCRFGISALLAKGRGAIVVTGATAAFRAFPSHAAYCASKGALLPLVKQVALDYGPAIRANLICPGLVDTPLFRDSARTLADPARAVAAAAAATPLQRLGAPEDVARLALFLASDDSSWITGAAFTIDGGILC